jgi:hypothetical protein
MGPITAISWSLVPRHLMPLDLFGQLVFFRLWLGINNSCAEVEYSSGCPCLCSLL